MESMKTEIIKFSPYNSRRGCSIGLCSLCIQFCHVFSPPPPVPVEFPIEESGQRVSPLIIVIIAILASTILVASYFLIISKYYRDLCPWRRRAERDQPVEHVDIARSDSMQHEPWIISTTGLDDKIIKAIAVIKYQKGERLIEGTACAVCLSEFQEEECLRVLPKCKHAFHISCIDVWLRSHVNCPLCRRKIIDIATNSSIQSMNELPERTASYIRSTQQIPIDDGNGIMAVDGAEENGIDELRDRDVNGVVSRSPVQSRSDARDWVVDIDCEQIYRIRRSVSMDCSTYRHTTIADVTDITDNDDLQTRRFSFGFLSTQRDQIKNNQIGRGVHSVNSPPPSMKRSSSSSQGFLFPRHGRGRNTVLPL